MEFRARIVDGFLTQEECESIVNLVSSIEPWQEDPDESLWSNRSLSDSIIKTKYSEEIGNKLYEIKARIAQEIKNFYNIDEVYADLLSISRWFPGMDQTPHADDMSNVDEEKYKWFHHRDFGSVIYLNTNYSGGHTYYPDHNIEVTPKAGTLVIHPASPDHLHGVTKIEGNVRYTISSFWTTDKSYDDSATLH